MGCRGCRKRAKEFKEKIMKEEKKEIKEFGRCEHRVFAGYWCKECGCNVPRPDKPLPEPKEVDPKDNYPEGEEE